MGFSFANAGETKSSPTPPIFTDKFEFTAVQVENGVNMTWNRFDSFSKDSFKYYKVVRSSSNPKPVYPEDGYITYSSDI